MKNQQGITTGWLFKVDGITQNKAAQAVCAFFIPLGARGEFPVVFLSLLLRSFSKGNQTAHFIAFSKGLLAASADTL